MSDFRINLSVHGTDDDDELGRSRRRTDEPAVNDAHFSTTRGAGGRKGGRKSGEKRRIIHQEIRAAEELS